MYETDLGALNLNAAELNGHLTQSQQLEAMQPFRGEKVNFSSRIYTVLGVPPAQEEVG